MDKATGVEDLRRDFGWRFPRHFAAVCEAAICGPDVTRGEGYFRLATGEAHPLGNFAVVSGGAAALAEAAGPLATHVPAMVRLLGEEDAARVAYLAEAGFTRSETPGLLLEIDKLRPTQLPAGYDFVKLEGPAGVVEWAEAAVEAFKMPAALARTWSPPAGPHRDVRYYGIRKDGKLVATSLIFLFDGVAGVYCVGTFESERRKGLGAHVTAEALRQARGEGYRLGALESSPMGLPVYLGMGFERVIDLPRFTRKPA